MINVKEGYAEITAESEVVMVGELITAIKAVHHTLEERHNKEYADKEIQRAVDLSKKTSEELTTEMIKKVNKLLDSIVENCKEPDEEPSSTNKATDDLLKAIFGRGDK